MSSLSNLDRAAACAPLSSEVAAGGCVHWVWKEHGCGVDRAPTWTPRQGTPRLGWGWSFLQSPMVADSSKLSETASRIAGGRVGQACHCFSA